MGVVFLALAAALVVRLLRTGGRAMLAMTDMSPDGMQVEMGTLD